MKEILDRLAIGKEKYGHGVRVDDDTTSWGTKENSWMEMAREEFLDAVVYVIADYIRKHRGPDGQMSELEIKYMWTPEFENAEDPKKWLEEHGEPDDNGLIRYILYRWHDMEPCKHKTLICTLLNILDLDLSFSKVVQFDLEPFGETIGPNL